MIEFDEGGEAGEMSRWGKDKYLGSDSFVATQYNDII